MTKQPSTGLWASLAAPVFLMTILLIPLLFVMVKRYISADLIPLALTNGVITTGGVMLNIFVYRQLSGKAGNLIIRILLIISSAGVATSGLIYIILANSLFFLYGLEVMASYWAVIFLIITSLSLMSSAFINNQRITEEERALREKEARLREEMERQIHSSRINPHFLFNSLNLMVSLLDDREKAEDVLIGLSELLRYNLDVSRLKEIPLSRELDSVRKYMFIQKERFGSRLEFVIEGETEDPIPPLILQPLVENSIKHNMDKCGKLEIEVFCRREREELHIMVLDSCAALEEDMIGNGTGLEVTRQRIKLAGGSLTIRDGGVAICLPMK